MRHNQAAVLTGIRTIDVMDWPMPVLQPDDVMVEIMACGVCGSDMHFFHHGRIGNTDVEYPLVLGHEASGVIVDVGSDIDVRRIGQRVSIEPQESCGKCAACRSGTYNLCPDVRYFSAPPIHGAFQRYVRIRSELAYQIPDAVSFEAAALMEPVSVVMWATDKARIVPGERVLVTGAGPIGNLAVQFAALNGAAEIVVIDVVDARLDIARTVGATSTINNASGGLADIDRNFDVLIECAGVPSIVEEALLHVRPAGRAVLVGMTPQASIPLPIAALQNREIELVGTFRFANTYERAIRMAASGRLVLDHLANARFTLADTFQALTAPQADPRTIKPVVYPGGI